MANCKEAYLIRVLEAPSGRGRMFTEWGFSSRGAAKIFAVKHPAVARIAIKPRLHGDWEEYDLGI